MVAALEEDQAQRVQAEQAFGTPIEDILRAVSSVVRRAVPDAEEACGLLGLI